MMRTVGDRSVPVRVAGVVAASVVALVLVLALGGCGLLRGSDGSGHGGGGGRHAGATGSATMPADAAAKKIMSTGEDDSKALASAKGTLDVSSSKSRVDARVLSIHAYPKTTQVLWRLKSTEDKQVDTGSFQLAYAPLFDTRQLGLEDAGTGTTYHPFTYVPMSGAGGRDLDCVCGSLPPHTDAKGVLLAAELPALPTSVNTVTVTLPGFAKMTDVPVSR